MKYLLFTTTTCPKCPAMKKYVEQNVPFRGEIIDETTSGFDDVARQHNVIGAPTLILFNSDKKEVYRATDTSELFGIDYAKLS